MDAAGVLDGMPAPAVYQPPPLFARGGTADR
jgi:hypothetical protein